jgi:hypothetical protein
MNREVRISPAAGFAAWSALLTVLFLLMAMSCKNDHKAGEEKENGGKPASVARVPDFNPDSAYHYISRQVGFGPRVPNTGAHSQCAAYLENMLQQFADTAITQSFKTRAFDGTILNGYNIIGSFNPSRPRRVLLCAHWDSRPFADYDPDPSKHHTAIDGANDGASGVGVLLEIARHMKAGKPQIGVDIIFFDAEDYGEPHNNQGQGMEDTWGLGSQYWTSHPHVPNYSALYGILLDMVGAKEARFYFESFSMMYAGRTLKKVWDAAHELGFRKYFLYEEGGYITDDHYYINKIIGIPTIDIIHLDRGSSNGSFFEQWHTTRDNIDAIDRETLEAVGQTLMKVIYTEK